MPDATREGSRRGAGPIGLSRSEPFGSDVARFVAEAEERGLYHPYVLLLGLEPLDTTRLVERVEEGFRFRELEHLRESVGLSREEVAEIVRIKPRTLDRRKKQGRLQPEESDRLLRATKVFGMAITLFEGDVGFAREWLSSPQTALGGAVPLQMARTDVGAREVEGLIGRLEHGVFS